MSTFILTPVLMEDTAELYPVTSLNTCFANPFCLLTLYFYIIYYTSKYVRLVTMETNVMFP